jgi:hypothetical protein
MELKKKMKKLIILLTILTNLNISAEYYAKINMNAGLENTDKKYEAGNYPIEERDESEWLKYLNDNCGASYADVNDMITSIEDGDNVDCYNLSLNYLPPKTGLPDELYYLDIEGNEFQNITGLSNIRMVEDTAYLASNPNLISLNGINNLQYAGYLYVYEAPLITNLEGLNSLNEAITFDVGDMDNLISFDGLDNISKVGRFTMYNLPVLNDISALSNISEITTSITFPSDLNLSQKNIKFRLFM